MEETALGPNPLPTPEDMPLSETEDEPLQKPETALGPNPLANPLPEAAKCQFFREKSFIRPNVNYYEITYELTYVLYIYT